MSIPSCRTDVPGEEGIAGSFAGSSVYCTTSVPPSWSPAGAWNVAGFPACTDQEDGYSIEYALGSLWFATSRWMTYWGSSTIQPSTLSSELLTWIHVLPPACWEPTIRIWAPWPSVVTLLDESDALLCTFRPTAGRIHTLPCSAGGDWRDWVVAPWPGAAPPPSAHPVSSTAA